MRISDWSSDVCSSDLVTNVADGVAATDAVNKGQLDTGIADAKAYTDTTATQTLSSANAYTDAKFAAWDDTFAAFQGEIDHRLAEQDRRIDKQGAMGRSEEHTSELQSLMRHSYAVFCLKKKTQNKSTKDHMT